MTITGRIGTAAVVEAQHLPGNINQHIVRIRLRGESLLPGFLAYFLNSDIGTALSNRGVTGTTRIALDYEAIRVIPVPVPPTEVQARMVNALRVSQKAREGKLAQADAMLNGIDDLVLAECGIAMPGSRPTRVFAVPVSEIKRRCVDYATRLDPHYNAPEFWKLVGCLRGMPNRPLGTIAQFSQDQWNPEDCKSARFNYIEISGVNLQTGEISAVSMAVTEAPDRARMLVQGGDILVSLTRPHRGAIGVVPTELDGAVASTGFAVIRQVFAKEYRPDFLLAILRSSICLQQMLQRSSGGNYPAITEAELRHVVVPLLPDRIQQRVVAEIARRKGEVRHLRAEAAAIWRRALEDFEGKLLAVNAKP